jgi:RNA polymerase sigma-70 factor (ECF subfamily)
MGAFQPTLATAHPPPREPGRERAKRLIADNFQFIYRVLRRLLPPHAADDATQQTFVVATQKIDEIAVGSERAYVFKTAMWVARHVRSAHARSREVTDDEAVATATDERPGPDELLAQQDRRRLLDAVLDAMPLDLRTVFVLFELEGIPMTQIAPLVGVPIGTVASRLRRARDVFHERARRLRAGHQRRRRHEP